MHIEVLTTKVKKIIVIVMTSLIIIMTLDIHVVANRGAWVIQVVTPGKLECCLRHAKPCNEHRISLRHNLKEPYPRPTNFNEKMRMFKGCK